eukprot:TRINITY_DN26908_c0_g1_i1.p1 TRINITY_DN26908_c0_g1~~TRINITY_DN26908_c0_g1_i1.p1  ORF type:complete len:328 (+),score=69.79 TRINITY_DN26908_c0_g1_i1:95-1078(+)
MAVKLCVAAVDVCTAGLEVCSVAVEALAPCLGGIAVAAAAPGEARRGLRKGPPRPVPGPAWEAEIRHAQECQRLDPSVPLAVPGEEALACWAQGEVPAADPRIMPEERLLHIAGEFKQALVQAKREFTEVEVDEDVFRIVAENVSVRCFDLAVVQRVHVWELAYNPNHCKTINGNSTIIWRDVQGVDADLIVKAMRFVFGEDLDWQAPHVEKWLAFAKLKARTSYDTWLRSDGQALWNGFIRRGRCYKDKKGATEDEDVDRDTVYDEEERFDDDIFNEDHVEDPLEADFGPLPEAVKANVALSLGSSTVSCFNDFGPIAQADWLFEW